MRSQLPSGHFANELRNARMPLEAVLFPPLDPSTSTLRKGRRGQTTLQLARFAALDTFWSQNFGRGRAVGQRRGKVGGREGLE